MPAMPDSVALVDQLRRPEDDVVAEELADEIRITVLHELAHHFGIDEDRLDELGYA